ncbi:MAG: hypothetical protein QGG67_08075 [Gammaproteobacteria bacterium]|jgi:hypothetical protein|nr:hypothetical protein [Gammaproteobacteria bacterium]MDP6095925.1 hypothetical protein [Gammaproteobacteria bacterium]HJO11003.1 hypothetical protein [Gammaproteobacteria bacterium]|tara:strand:- start:4482 stop:5084 length:603 start_codon:yes stop_codon:yes gene_type:complete
MSDSQQTGSSDTNTPYQEQQRTILVNQGNTFRSTDPRRKSPQGAAFLSLLPGLGQVYVGYYRRGFINIFVAGGVFSLLVATPNNAPPYMPLGVFFLIFFELYNMIDAYRRAIMYNLSLDGIEQITMPDEINDSAFDNIGGSFLGGGILLLFGVIALSNTAFGLSLEWLESWWPVLPMGFGGYLVFKAYQDSQLEGGTEDA